MARSNRSIYAALAANIVIAICKFIAGGISKSSAMISEGVHSLVDSVNELLLLYGIHRSNRQRDKTRPFGYLKNIFDGFGTIVFFACPYIKGIPCRKKDSGRWPV